KVHNVQKKVPLAEYLLYASSDCFREINTFFTLHTQKKHFEPAKCFLIPITSNNRTTSVSKTNLARNTSGTFNSYRQDFFHQRINRKINGIRYSSPLNAFTAPTIVNTKTNMESIHNRKIPTITKVKTPKIRP